MQNFSIWRGRLPHWRADDVRYYVTFRHRRALTPLERDQLFKALLQPVGTRWDLYVLCVLPETTELMASVNVGRDGRPIELSEIVEPAKRQAGKAILKKSGERFSPFYEESYDRIVRDDAEFEERWMEIVHSPETLELVEAADDYPTLWLS